MSVAMKSQHDGEFVGRHQHYYIDGWLLFSAISLLALGYVMVVSASLHLGEKMYTDISHYPLRQFAHIVVGLVMAFILAKTPLRVWEESGPSLILVAIGLLVLVFIPGVGVKVNGSYRWVNLGIARLQVSEMVKFICVIYIAGFLTRHVDIVRKSIKGVIKPILPLGLVFGLLMAEPDFGATFVIGFTVICMMFLGGARLVEFAALVLIGLMLGVVAIVSSAYRMERVTAFLDPWADHLDSGFQLVQSLIAMGRGEWLGVGLGSSIQKLFYLPEAHTDFIFAVLGEELGLLGSCSVILLFGLFVWRTFQMGKAAERLNLRFYSLLAYGLGVWVGLQAFVNIAVNMGSLPTKGLTLPFMSYGGSSMVVMCMVVGLLCRIHHETNLDRENQIKRSGPWQYA
ncbi:MAG: putative lipid II flippase FtsW [Piscirickettsiaceae bacterium]|nr:MAG: putative lipid II flippase FtsW [Piscirickettsiaceae bacterium]PCI70824.1 MAG: putative lipid II flippase FtsW [Piscirickettsiaceae bacterium]